VCGRILCRERWAVHESMCTLRTLRDHRFSHIDVTSDSRSHSQRRSVYARCGNHDCRARTISIAPSATPRLQHRSQLSSFSLRWQHRYRQHCDSVRPPIGLHEHRHNLFRSQRRICQRTRRAYCIRLHRPGVCATDSSLHKRLTGTCFRLHFHPCKRKIMLRGHRFYWWHGFVPAAREA
jgi:hypothetical protein